MIASTTNFLSGSRPSAREAWGRPVDRTTVLLLGLGRLGRIFASSLETEQVKVRASLDGTRAYELTQRAAPDLVVVGTSGATDAVHLVSEVRRARPGAVILYLTPSADPSDAIPALQHGADDVVCPPHSLSQVMLRARLVGHVRNGGIQSMPFAFETKGNGPILVERTSRRVLTSDPQVSLTGRELELLERLTDASGQVVTRRRLLQDIWGSDQESEAVLDATVHRLRRKLEPEPADPTVLTTIRGVGYRLESELIRLVDGRPGA